MDMGFLNNVTLLLAAVIMIMAAANDAMRFKIPNLACLALLLLFPAFAISSPSDLPWLKHLQVFALVLAVGYVLYIKKWAGAGDIKLIAIISLWAGPVLYGPFLFITAISGGLFSIVIGIQAYIKQRRMPPENQSAWTKTPIPYGIAITLGGLCTLALLSHPELLAKV